MFLYQIDQHLSQELRSPARDKNLDSSDNELGVTLDLRTWHKGPTPRHLSGSA